LKVGGTQNSKDYNKIETAKLCIFEIKLYNFQTLKLKKMYIYNVTTNVDASIHQEWLKWMKEKHIPTMLSLGKFTNAKMIQVMVEEEMGGTTYAVQYTTDSLETLQEYYQQDAEKLRAEVMHLFKDKIVAFRTELKVISEQFSMSLKN